MLWTPAHGIMRTWASFSGASSVGTAVVTGGASSTKGAPAQITASTPFDSYLIRIAASLYALSATASEGCLDLLIGAATEEVLIPNLLMGYSSAGVGAAHAQTWVFPLYIPAGSRLAVRTAGVRTSASSRVGVTLYGGNGAPPFRVGSKVTTYGIGTVPNGTVVVPGTSGAEGAWTQIAASTSEDHFCLVPSFQPATDKSITGSIFAVDIGAGAATEELISLPHTYSFSASEGGGLIWSPAFPLMQNIPASTRLVMRVSNSGANDARYQGAIHAVS